MVYSTFQKCFSLESISKWFFFNLFLFLTSAYQNYRKALKSINLMFFQSKCTFKKHLKMEATTLPNRTKNTKYPSFFSLFLLPFLLCFSLLFSCPFHYLSFLIFLFPPPIQQSSLPSTSIFFLCHTLLYNPFFLSLLYFLLPPPSLYLKRYFKHYMYIPQIC